MKSMKVKNDVKYEDETSFLKIKSNSKNIGNFFDWANKIFSSTKEMIAFKA